ncbi:MAG TPA: S-methyl-5-thioribose kinase [Candidatus Cybelea sp.]|nr:S-methyl-5-thioribose kinase [Candidatus Cybelea sp.]
MNRIDIPAGYRPQNTASLKTYLGAIDQIRGRLSGRPEDWRIEEVGDGNLNLVFKVWGPAGGIAVKQALPYLRLVGESWPLPLSRAHFEQLALQEQWRAAPGLVPALLHVDQSMALTVMELLEPHIIMRRGMIEGRVYPRFIDDITTFAAQTHFRTSDLFLTADRKKLLVGTFAGNFELCKITEDLVFTEPYIAAARNRWTTPQLDPYVTRFRADGDLKIAVSRLKLQFIDHAQALIHGDLHTGSVMVTEGDTRIIDPEFAFVGPIGFDLGAVIGNLLLNYLAQDGHEDVPGARDSYREWVLGVVQAFWPEYRRKFLALWREQGAGDAYPKAMFADAAGEERLEIERAAYMARLFGEMIGFAGVKMIRRIFGLAHNIDFEWIAEPARRASCEARAVTLAREMILGSAEIRGPGDLCDKARALRNWNPPLG